ncbi:reverse transcriptase domain-containing protein [Tanacetum coccineum]|uniref:Reverse transcriptase domain-containing protein n=1 Tax=Tanacetum coccineum TaxID=301880 RepID=A0ABQ5FG63_9ASTR
MEAGIKGQTTMVVGTTINRTFLHVRMIRGMTAAGVITKDTTIEGNKSITSSWILLPSFQAKKEILDRYYDYHGKKRHYTNECYQLKRQLEAALESKKLSHLVEDVRQQGNNKGRHPGITTTEERAAVQVMFEHYFDNLSPAIKARLTPTQTELVGFSGEQLIPIGKVELKVTFGGGCLSRTVMLKFTVVRVSSPYNSILGRTRMRELWAVSSYRSCHEKKVKHDEKVEKMEPENPEETGEEKVLVNPAFPKQKVTIGTQFSAECQERLISLLKNSMDVFAWQPSDMVGVPRRIIKHTLNVNVSVSPVAQKRRVLDTEKSRAVMKEVEEWVKAGILRPMKYPTWISNPVLYWDFLLNASWTRTRDTIRFKCLKMMKKRWPSTMIKELIEAYVDDMVIKSKTEQEMIADIAETFDNLRKVKMKLNLKKCSFRVKEGKFLGYMVMLEGIRANLKKTKVVAYMKSPKTLKEMQSLSGKLATLNRFLSRSAERAMPFFKTLKNITKENKDDYRWTKDAE